jgi:hypothetical protein
MTQQAERTTLRIFDRIVCGIDESESSLEAARQAERLRDPLGRLHLATIVETATAAHAGCSSRELAVRRRRAGQSPLGRRRGPGRDAHGGRLRRAPPRRRDRARHSRHASSPRGAVLGPGCANAVRDAGISLEHPRGNGRLGGVASGRSRCARHRRPVRRGASRNHRDRRQGGRSRARGGCDSAPPRGSADAGGRARRPRRRGGPPRRRKSRTSRRQGTRERERACRAPRAVLGPRRPLGVGSRHGSDPRPRGSAPAGDRQRRL